MAIARAEYRSSSSGYAASAMTIPAMIASISAATLSTATPRKAANCASLTRTELVIIAFCPLPSSAIAPSTNSPATAGRAADFKWDSMSIVATASSHGGATMRRDGATEHPAIRRGGDNSAPYQAREPLTIAATVTITGIAIGRPTTSASEDRLLGVAASRPFGPGYAAGASGH